jgi:signal transduction histidine kinase
MASTPNTLLTAAPSRQGADRRNPQTSLEGTANWTLDITAARPLIVSVAAGAGRPDWVEALLLETRIVDVNPTAVHLVGPYAGRNRMVGQAVSAFWPREGRPALADLIVSAVTENRPGSFHMRGVASLAFVDPVLSVWIAEGGPPGFVHVALSGTPMDERSLWALRASEERYRNLIHDLPCALLQVDSTPMTSIFENLRLEGITDIAPYLDEAPDLPLHSRQIVQVTDANRKAVQLFAAGSSGRLIGSVDFLFAASPDTAKRVITAHFEGRRTYTEQMKVRTFEGQLRDVELTVTYPTFPERLDVTLLSLEDITDRLRTEAQLRQLQADHARAARISMLGELATSIAHEVNQPLSAIVTNAETSLRWLARADPNVAKVVQLVSRIAGSARHASEIVQRIRGMTAPRGVERIALDLNVIVDESLLFIRHEIEVRSIELSVELNRSLPFVAGDRIQLQQVVFNLLLNAVQALGTLSEGRIEVRTATADDGAVLFSIHDSGPGIAEENLDRIFDSFFTTKSDGMGIGLAICQSIVAAHGGTLTASNHVAGGAFFRFSLPPASRT